MLKINQIYKVKEGHEGKCETYKDEKGKYIIITDFQYNILNKDKKITGYCECCLTEDDLEIEEEVKEYKINPDIFKDMNFKIDIPTIKCVFCGNDILDTPNNRMENRREKSLEVGDEAIKRILNRIYKMKEEARVGTGWTCDSKLMTLRFDKLINEIKDITNYNPITTLSPSEAETLLEEKLGIKVKIK